MSNYGKRSFRRSTKPKVKRFSKAKTNSRRKTSNRAASSAFITKPALTGPVYKTPQPGRQIGYLPFAQTMRVRLPWVWSSGLTSPTLGAGSIYYRLNSLFDPDNAVGGHQPMQYDQLCPAVYQSYIVYGCKVEIEYNNPLSDGLYVGYGVYNSAINTGGAGLKLDHLGERRDITMRPLNNTGSQVTKFSIYVPLHTVMQQSKEQYMTDLANNGAAYNANPASAPLLELLALSSTGIAISCNFRLRMTYYSKLYDSKSTAQS